MLVMVLEKKIIPHDPFTQMPWETYVEDGKLRYDRPPVAPSEKYWFGTDIMNRDIFSRVIAGTKITLKLALLTTLVKFGIALPFAFLAGFKSKTFSFIIGFFNKLFSGIPSLLIAIFVLRMDFINMLQLDASIFYFALIIGFIEWGRIANIFENRIKDILNMDFIQGDIAIGKSKWQIGYKNVLNHLLPTLIVFFFLEMSRTLIFIAQLGVFNIFVGATGISSSEQGFRNLSITPAYYPEWGSMIANSRYAIAASQPWLVLPAIGAFFITILGFNMLGEGLKREVESRKKTFLNQTKDLIIYLSPMTYWKEIRGFRNHRVPVILRSTAIVVFIIILLLPGEKSLITVDSENLEAQLVEIMNEKYDGRMTGSQGNRAFGDYIVEQFKANGIQPLMDGDYFMEYKTREAYADFNSSSIQIVDEHGSEVIELNYREDYQFYEYVFAQEEFSGILLNYKDFKDNEAFYEETGEKYFVIFDTEALKNRSIRRTMRGMSKYKSVAGIFQFTESIPDNFGVYTETRDYEEYLEEENRKILTPFYITATYDVMEIVNDNLGKKVKVLNDLNPTVQMGRNIGGVIRGKNRDIEPIYITTNYDYLDGNELFNAKGLLYNGTSVAAILEMVNGIGNYDLVPERDIVFLVFDGSNFFKGEQLGIEKHFYYNPLEFNEESFFIGFNYLGVKDADCLYVDKERFGNQELERSQYPLYFAKRTEFLGLQANYVPVLTRDSGFAGFDDVGIPGMFMQDINQGSKRLYDYREQKELSQVDIDRLRSETQLIVDTIMEAAYKSNREEQ